MTGFASNEKLDKTLGIILKLKMILYFNLEGVILFIVDNESNLY